MLANFLKAAIEPVKVTPPINTPKKAANECKTSGCPHETYDARDVVTAAKPTKAWKAATVYGNSVG